MRDIATYNEDGRASLCELNARYDKLELQYGFIKEPIYTVNIEAEAAQNAVTVYCYRSARTGPALWILSGIHGEEPAGPNAIAQNIENLGELGQDLPLVIFPLLNPQGYYRNWRYPDERREWRVGHSVSDSEHYLPDLNDPSRARVPWPRTDICARVTEFVLAATINYPPVLTIDHHEDEVIEFGYIYSQAPAADDDRVAKEAIQLLLKSGIPLQMHGRTRFEELIRDGVVVGENGQPVKDGSVDELLAAETIIVAGEVVAKPGALASLVIETPITNVPLGKRIEAHANIIRGLRLLWSLATKQPS